MRGSIAVRAYRGEDYGEWRRMRSALWPEQTDDDMRTWLARSGVVTVVAERENGGLCGFAEAAVRSYADGCATAPVAYLEGWFVDPDCRRLGVGRTLVSEVARWARGRGLRELASDAEIDNIESQRAHKAVGFGEVGRAVLYARRV